MSGRDVGLKLRRLLYIVPYVAKHPEGVPVEQLARMLNTERDELLADLDLLSQVGPPDGDPGEYLLVSVEDGRGSALGRFFTPDGELVATVVQEGMLRAGGTR